MRGSGDSDGILMDEYLPLEQDDALEILRWIAAQPWSTGDVGMFGISWGGFNGLQVAALAPPELKTIITLFCDEGEKYVQEHFAGEGEVRMNAEKFT
jgi:putative CocE/NonD family hydrolase